MRWNRWQLYMEYAKQLNTQDFLQNLSMAPLVYEANSSNISG